jgi:hypothetical protein
VLKKYAGELSHEARQHTVSRAVVGPGFIAVQLENGSMGLCANIAHTQGGSRDLHRSCPMKKVILEVR